MKKIIYTVFFLCIFTLFSKPLQAQTTTFGLRGGLNIATLKNRHFDSSLIGFMGGFYTNIGLGKHNFTFSPEVLYTRKGATSNKVIGNDKNGNRVQGKEIIKIDYIEIPVLFKYHFPSAGPAKPALYAGPYVGFKVRSKTKFKGPDFKDELPDPPVLDQDYGLTLGGSVDLGRLNVGVRYDYGIPDIHKKGKTTLNGPHSKAKNRVLSFVAGVGF